MNFQDMIYVFQWWAMFFVVGLIFFPLTAKIFSNFFDRGYIFSRILGIAVISYVVFVLGVLKIAPFTNVTIILVIIIFIFFNIFLIMRLRHSGRPKARPESPSVIRDAGQASMTTTAIWKMFLFEEIIFFATLFFWSYIRSHQADIHGLEKYEDFGFINSILRSEHFPPRDMWFTPFSINYYYFGHLVTAVLTKLSSIPSYITFNLMLATVFALTFTGAFSIGANLTEKFKVQSVSRRTKFKVILAGLLTGFLVTMGGSLHTVYTFFKPYVNENPVPFWQLVFSPNTFPNSYWYPNATRFIQNTIHEPPVYSAVVSDLHAHFLDMPFVLLTIAILLSLILKSQITNHKQISNSNVQNSKRFGDSNFGYLNLFRISDFGFRILLLAFMLAIMYMTNAWDGIIYFLLAAIILLFLSIQQRRTSTMEIKNDPFDKTQGHPERSRMDEKLKIKNSFQIENFKLKIIRWLFYISIIIIGSILFSLPFSLSFKPFASGIGVLCAPEFLTKIEKLGPFLFEAEHCQRSPLWQLAILYGFFYFWVISFIIFLFKNSKHKARNLKQYQMTKIQNSKRFGHLDFENSNLFRISNLEFRISSSDVFVLILIILSTLLIIIPEFIYVKDIYPGHYRANTMFKLVYQAFIMLSIASAYIIIRVMPLILRRLKNSLPNIFNFYFVFFIFSFLFFILVSIYPYFAINPYYGELKIYHGLDGLQYLKKLYPTDYDAIMWINDNIKGQPVILEAQGDSYSDYGRVSTNTGFPTVLGWTVHEWLWRGSYDIPAPRIPEVQNMYESGGLEETRGLLKKYDVELVFFGDLERQKYLKLNEEKFKQLGKVIYENGKTKIYEILF